MMIRSVSYNLVSSNSFLGCEEHTAVSQVFNDQMNTSIVKLYSHS